MPPTSPMLLRWFKRYTRWYLARHFHSHLLSLESRNRIAPSRDNLPLLIYLNHPSWWDPLTCLMLADKLWPHRRHCAPIDADGLAQYPILSRLGFIPVQRDSIAGARHFLTRCGEVLAEDGAVLWMTAGGAFADVRQRPARLLPGIGRLIRNAKSPLRVMPLAIEYVFWNQRLPEILCHFGSPGDHGDMATLEQKMSDTQDELATLAVARNAGAFDSILAGRTGVGGVYDLWRRGAATLRGRRFMAEHVSRGEGISS